MRRSTTRWFWTKTSTWGTTCWPTTNCASKCQIRGVVISRDDHSLSLGPNRFCSRLGTLFGFVVNDLQDKIGRLNALVADDEEHFSTVQNMIIYETSNNILRKGTSGSVTLLRLHRGLGNGVPIRMFFFCFTHTLFISEFIILFMSKLLKLKPTESTTSAAQEAYNKTLAKHHSWLIRNAARLSMNLLPCQSTLYHQVSNSFQLSFFLSFRYYIYICFTHIMNVSICTFTNVLSIYFSFSLCNY